MKLDFHVNWQNPTLLNVWRGYTTKYEIDNENNGLLSIENYKGQFRIEKLSEEKETGYQKLEGFITCPKSLSKDELTHFLKNKGFEINFNNLKEWI